ncbi:Flp family type IVb pilin [Bradyrhizobium septentrionale]|uniref:Flp family type IVb pilin n=1 Tax=Bradyrhizobium septentrionale TaxID=1404411 RepID=A0A973VWY5_9BRAD|nr:Flp family type IVb pilin [Bradyrhizobium septentrionale]UGY20169.1 Flp family type IVb pilin [Bradyrhizobium septentrionale]
MIAEAQRLTALKREKIELVVAATARSSEAIDLDAIDHMHDNPVTDDDCEVIAFDRHRLAQRLPLRMPNLGAVILPFVPDQRGVTSIQYSILCAGIALAIVSSLGGTLGAAFQSISAYLGGGGRWRAKRSFDRRRPSSLRRFVPASFNTSKST